MAMVATMAAMLVASTAIAAEPSKHRDPVRAKQAGKGPKATPAQRDASPTRTKGSTTHRRASSTKAANANATTRPTSRPASSRTVVDAASLHGDYATRGDVGSLIDELVDTRGFSRDALRAVFADARYNETAARLMMPALVGTARNWPAYRARFVEPVRLAAGRRFWDENDEWLRRAERTFGVPPEIVVGILGVETVYGRNTGSFRVLDALTTLAFDYPNKTRDRSPFFRAQLIDALVLSRDRGSDIRLLFGSYAGAIGMPQFMPGSILSDAVDFDGDGTIDLVGSTADIIGSVANYLARRGWKTGLATHVVLGRATDATGSGDATRVDAMVDAGSVPTWTFADLSSAGFVSDDLPPDVPFALIDLPSGTDPSGAPLVRYLAGTKNFHAITLYNRNYFYAYAVIELGNAIKAAREGR